MKFAAIASTAALLAVANAASCDVTSLQTLLTSSDTTTCATDSGYTVTSLATPTDAQMAIMCTSSACQSVLTQLESLAPSECTLGTFALYADLITPLQEYCSGSTGSTSTTATAGSSATTATVGSTAGTNSTDTVTASSTGSTDSTITTSSTTSSGSSTSQTATSSSAASAAASASTSGSSGASMAAVSAGAVLAAVAATFF